MSPVDVIEPIVQAAPMVTRRETAKLRQIFDGAWKIFLHDGYDATSMNDVARAAAVSKGTLYVYFPSKAALFEALIRDAREQQSERFLSLDSLSDDLPASLQRIGTALMTMVLSREHVAHLRIVAAVAAKLPKIGQTYYEAGPCHGFRRLAAFLDRHVSAGSLRAIDTETAAVTFINLCQGRLLKEALFGVREGANEAEIAASVRNGVAVFLRAYGEGAMRDFAG